MDGIPFFSLDNRTSLFLNALPVPAGQARSRTSVAFNTSQLSVKVNISRAGNEIWQRVRDQERRLAQVDAALVNQYRTVVDLLNRINPQVTKHFLDVMDKLLDRARVSEAVPLLLPQALPADVHLDVSVSLQVEQLVAQVRGKNIFVVQQSLEVNMELHRGTFRD